MKLKCRVYEKRWGKKRKNEKEKVVVRSYIVTRLGVKYCTWTQYLDLSTKYLYLDSKLFKIKYLDLYLKPKYWQVPFKYFK